MRSKTSHDLLGTYTDYKQKHVVRLFRCTTFCKRMHVHTVQQKSSGMKFPKSRTGRHVTYSCRQNSSRFIFLIFVHSWRFSVVHSLQSITLRIYEPKTPIHFP